MPKVLRHSFDDFDVNFIVKSKSRNRLKEKRKKEEILHGDGVKSKAYQKMMELPIPESSKTVLSKLLINGQLVCIVKVLSRKIHSTVLHGKVNLLHRNFSDLQSDDVIIKILINGQPAQLHQRIETEVSHLKNDESRLNCPKFVIQFENIYLMSMIGEGEPAKTLRQILYSKESNIEITFNEMYDLWSSTRHKKFNPSNILWHENKWWMVGYGEVVDNYCYGQELLQFHAASQKLLIDTFIKHGLPRSKAREEIMQIFSNYGWEKRIFR